jgi:hypothetical protein
VTAMADYALRIREQLSYVNEHSFNNFRIRIGQTLGFDVKMRLERLIPSFQQRYFSHAILSFLLLVIFIYRGCKTFLGESNQADRYHSACNNKVFFKIYIFIDVTVCVT